MKEYWSTEARNILKGLLAREDSTYKVLAKRLEHTGVTENADQLRNKINRGTFSFAFFLKCLHALGQTEARITVKRPKSTPCEKQPLLPTTYVHHEDHISASPQFSIAYCAKIFN